MRCSRIGCQRDVERHEVGFDEKLLERNVGHLMFAREVAVFEWVEREDAHIESPGAFCDLLADPSQADDPDRCPAHLSTEQEEGTPGLPLAVTDIGHRLGNAARGGEQQRPGVIRGGVRQHVRSVADEHAALAGRGDVDVVVADREVRDDAQTGVPVEDRAIDAIGEQGDGAIAALQQGIELVWARRQLLIPELDRRSPLAMAEVPRPESRV